LGLGRHQTVNKYTCSFEVFFVVEHFLFRTVSLNFQVTDLYCTTLLLHCSSCYSCVWKIFPQESEPLVMNPIFENKKINITNSYIKSSTTLAEKTKKYRTTYNHRYTGIISTNTKTTMLKYFTCNITSMSRSVLFHLQVELQLSLRL
jgi:hypothetical protein